MNKKTMFPRVVVDSEEVVFAIHTIVIGYSTDKIIAIRRRLQRVGAVSVDESG